MLRSQKLTLSVLLTVTGLVIVGLIVTGRVRPASTAAQKAAAAAAPKQTLVDDEPLDTARSLTPLASAPAEQQYAQTAVRLTDNEVDLAFAIALRTASLRTAAETPATKSLEERVETAEAEASAAQDRVNRLTTASAQAKGSRKENLDAQLQLAQAELELDQDQLANAKEDLARAKGDVQGELQRLWQEHEQLHSGLGAASAQTNHGAAPPTQPSSGSLIQKWQAWSALRAKRAQLLAALGGAHRVSAALALEHDKLLQQVRAEQPQKRTQAEEAASLLATKPSDNAQPQQTAAAAVSALRRLSVDQKNLADLVKRIQDFNQLSVTYWRWGALAAADAQAALHSILISVLWIVGFLLLAFLVNLLIDQTLARLGYDSKRVITLHTVARFTVRTVAILLILLVIFGLPSNLSTALGLAGAGLTVALKDFILSFCGWFVLMGRNGIRMGDWVEINGVRGEVAEIGLLRTVILETGNWTDPGHPTGRQVAFPNSFAVEGYYFNFSTSGQWLWDEIQFHIGRGLDPYEVIEKIQAIAQKETEAYARRAEEEWKGITRRYRVKTFSSAPAVNVKSTGQGVDVVVRYIAPAHERYEVRSRMNQAVVDLLHRRKPAGAAAEAAPQPAEITALGNREQSGVAGSGV